LDFSNLIREKETQQKYLLQFK